MDRERLTKAAEAAKASGKIPGGLIEKALELAELEVREDASCPVPDCLSVLLEESINAGPKNPALLYLVKILDLRDQHFSNPEGKSVYYPY